MEQEKNFIKEFSDYNNLVYWEDNMAFVIVEDVDKRRQALILREKVMLVEAARLNGRNTMSIPEARKVLGERALESLTLACWAKGR